jgi:hypothetical protein
MNEEKWYNVELNQKEAEKFKEYLEDEGYPFETSGCFELVHFEISLNLTQFDEVNKWMDENIYKDAIINQ